MMKCWFCSKHNPSLGHRIRCAAVYILIVYPYLYLWRLTLEELFVRLLDRVRKHFDKNVLHSLHYAGFIMSALMTAAGFISNSIPALMSGLCILIITIMSIYELSKE
jgi:hypothetical protein